jgi:hypothetical protein
VELLLRPAALLLVVLAGSSCRNEAKLERQEKRAQDESVSKAKDEVHKINMKELEGAELTPEEAAARQVLKDVIEEEENGGNAPPPPEPPPSAEEPATAPAASP